MPRDGLDALLGLAQPSRGPGQRFGAAILRASARSTFSREASCSGRSAALADLMRSFEIRQKLGDNPLNPTYIFTEPGIGYLLIEDK